MINTGYFNVNVEGGRRMKIKAVSGIMVTLLLTCVLLLAFNIPSVKAGPKTIYVDAKNVGDPSEDGSQKHPFDKIQEGVNAAGLEDIIFAYNGTYYENVTIDKPLNLIGQNPENTLIEGVYRTEFLVNITVSNVAVEGFTIRNGHHAIHALSPQFEYLDNIIIKNNVITENNLAVIICLIPRNCLIENNVIVNNRAGVFLWGLPDKLGFENTVRYNVVKRQEWDGISMMSCSGTEVVGNTLSFNCDSGLDLSHSDNTVVYHNNFIDNVNQVYLHESSDTIWDDGYPSGGNYWSDHVAVDDYSGINQDELGSDGIVDEPYIVDYNNRDNYPLMNPWDTISPVANAGQDQTVYVDTLVTFDGSGSSDNVGIASYIWSFIDVTPQTLIGVNPTYTFTTSGIYTVTLNVSDAAGYHATDTVTITVLNWTPEALTQRLVVTIETWNLPKGTENSLVSKLKETIHLLDAGNENGAIHKLVDFIDRVEALRGKKLTNEQANYLIAEAQRIIDLIKG